MCGACAGAAGGAPAGSGGRPARPRVDPPARGPGATPTRLLTCHVHTGQRLLLRHPGAGPQEGLAVQVHGHVLGGLWIGLQGGRGRALWVLGLHRRRAPVNAPARPCHPGTQAGAPAHTAFTAWRSPPEGCAQPGARGVGWGGGVLLREGRGPACASMQRRRCAHQRQLVRGECSGRIQPRAIAHDNLLPNGYAREGNQGLLDGIHAATHSRSPQREIGARGCDRTTRLVRQLRPRPGTGASAGQHTPASLSPGLGAGVQLQRLARVSHEHQYHTHAAHMPFGGTGGVSTNKLNGSDRRRS
jgi:hypothetical protein